MRRPQTPSRCAAPRIGVHVAAENRPAQSCLGVMGQTRIRRGSTNRQVCNSLITEMTSCIVAPNVLCPKFGV
jgi:hypothetical protein